jgi:L-methionine (R)-S-oxide reductase
LNEREINQLIKLQDMSNFLEKGSLDDNLLELAKMTANILNAENCSIMLLNDGESENPRLCIYANHGKLPAVAYQESIGKGEGIAGHVVSTGKSLLIENIDKSEFFNQARRAKDSRKSLVCSPVKINKQIIGVVNVSGHVDGAAFNSTDLNLLEVIALFIGKSIQAIQLQKILNSRFTQIALAQSETNKTDHSTGNNTLHNPDQLAKILAKTFYKELVNMDFGSGQIITAASEIITQLNSNIQPHNKGAKKEL